MPITERLGRGPWLDRMEDLMSRIWAVAPVQTSYGAIPSDLAEPNGDLLQGLCRLYSATGKEIYLEWAERLGDVYLLEILPRSGFLPPKQWDFKTGNFASNEVWLRDHGNELITGLAELACIECLASRPRCGTYIPPLLTMMDLLLAKGRNKDGLWYNALDRQGDQLQGEKGAPLRQLGISVCCLPCAGAGAGEQGDRAPLHTYIPAGGQKDAGEYPPLFLFPLGERV